MSIKGAMSRQYLDDRTISTETSYFENYLIQATAS
jgi:hypothetical protein